MLIEDKKTGVRYDVVYCTSTGYKLISNGCRLSKPASSYRIIYTPIFYIKIAGNVSHKNVWYNSHRNKIFKSIGLYKQDDHLSAMLWYIHKSEWIRGYNRNTPIFVSKEEAIDITDYIKKGKNYINIFNAANNISDRFNSEDFRNV